MKCIVAVVIVFLSTIKCQNMFNDNDKNDETNPRIQQDSLTSPANKNTPPLNYQLPLQMTFLGNKHPFYHYEEALPLYLQQQQAQQSSSYQNTAPTTLSRVVETKYGKLQGLTVSLFPQGSNSNNIKNSHPLRNKMVEVFLTVPYASPPTKSHRFSPTQTPIPWNGIRTVIKPGFVCPQAMPDIHDENTALKEMPRGYLDYLRRVEPYLRNQSEDCLYLNIFSPLTTTTTSYQYQHPHQQQQQTAGGTFSSSSESKLRLKPVLVFIHGGKFSWGSGNLYDGTMLAGYADVLVVTLNYRLGVLGFLNINSSPNTRPRVANYGLMDQIASLNWIKENIAAFGGDPDNITLMGYEAGAACIHFLMSSPAVVPGLFHRAILIAGSARAPWALVDDPASVANALAESLNCSINPSSPSSAAAVNILNETLPTFTQIINNGRERDFLGGIGNGNTRNIQNPLLDCFKNKHFSYFSKFSPPKFTVDFGPSIDGIVIQQNFWSASESQIGKRDVTAKYDLMFGLSSLEMLTSFAEKDLQNGFDPSKREAVLRTLVRNSYRFHLNEILATIANEYVDWERGIQHPIAARDLTINAVTDCLSLAPVIAASESSQIRRSFFYLFEHSTKDGLYTFQRSGGAGGEELNYFFGFPLMENVLPFFPSSIPANYTKAEMALSEIMITYLLNFLYSGDPNEPNQGELIWPISKEKNKFRNVLWDPYERIHQKYIEFTANKVRIRSHYRAHQMATWLRLVPELQKSGAQYASAMHNQMSGGYDHSLYVGSFRLPEEVEAAAAANEFHHFGDLSDLYFGNGSNSGIAPSPPTTCFSPLSSLTAGELENGNTGSMTRFLVENQSNSTGAKSRFFSTYASNLLLTIGVGCALLILNIFIFAFLYYHHDKRRRKIVERGNNRFLGENGNTSPNITAAACESQQLNSYGEPPELLKSNSTIATSFHQSQSIYSYEVDDAPQHSASTVAVDGDYDDEEEENRRRRRRREDGDYFQQQQHNHLLLRGESGNVNFATFPNSSNSNNVGKSSNSSRKVGKISFEAQESQLVSNPNVVVAGGGCYTSAAVATNDELAFSLNNAHNNEVGGGEVHFSQHLPSHSHHHQQQHHLAIQDYNQLIQQHHHQQQQIHQSSHYQPQEEIHEQELLLFHHNNEQQHQGELDTRVYLNFQPNNSRNEVRFQQQQFGISSTLPPKHSNNIRKIQQQQESDNFIPTTGNLNLAVPSSSSSTEAAAGSGTCTGAPATNSSSNSSNTMPKPIPPTRNMSNYCTITQRQLFSVIMSLFTLGIL